MSLGHVFDPLFRVPFANGLLLALVLPVLGSYVRLRNEWLAALGLTAVVAVAGPWLSRMLILEHFFPENMAANRQSPWRLHLAFDLLAAFSVALATESIGVMATFCLVFLPPWVAFRFAASWKRALVHATGLSVTAYLAAFVLAIALDQPFGPVLVGTLVVAGLAPLPFHARR